MSHVGSPLPPRGWRRKLAIGTFIVGIAIFIACTVSFFRIDKEKNLLFRFGYALYSSGQLLLLNFETKPGEVKAWPLETARLVAPFVLGSTAFLVLSEIFGSLIRLLMLRRKSNHVVVCGLNEQNMNLVRGLRKSLVKGARKRKLEVVVIDMNPVDELVRSVEEVGAIVLTGDATKANILRKALVGRAKHLIAREADDGRNVAIGLNASQVRREHAPNSTPEFHCFLHVAHLELRDLFGQYGVLAKKTKEITFHLFNKYENYARSLLKKHPLEPFRFGPLDPRTVHLVIIGFGEMGESIALQAAKIAHFANGKKLRLTVIDRKANARKKYLKNCHPCFDQVCDVNFIEQEANDPELAVEMAEWSKDEGSITTFAICFNNDSDSLWFALYLVRIIDRRAPIRVRMASRTGLRTLLPDGSSESPEISENLTVFGEPSEAMEVELIIGENLDSLARAVHEDFLNKRADAKGSPRKDSSREPWEQLGEEFVESNRQQADHIVTKLRAIGCFSSSPINEAPYSFSKSDVEVLARMEHARWMAERHLAGWKYSPEDKDVKEKTSPYLIDWKYLEDKVKQYDRDAICSIHEILKGVGEKIYWKSPTDC